VRSINLPHPAGQAERLRIDLATNASSQVDVARTGLTELEMMHTEIQKIAEAAEKACTATINDPRNIDLREDLFGVLREVVDLGRAAEATHSGHLHDLLRETGLWADIVRCRIDISRSHPVTYPVASIRHPVRDLKHLLSQLTGEIENFSGARIRSGGA
jgi:hypothetical protein